MQQQQNNQGSLDDELINTFVNELQARLPQGFRVNYRQADEDRFSRAKIFISTQHHDILETPLFQIDKNYNLYNIPFGNNFDTIIRNRNGVNIRDTLANPNSSTTDDAWQTIMNHFNHIVTAGSLYDGLEIENSDVIYFLENGIPYPYVNGNKLT